MYLAAMIPLKNGIALVYRLCQINGVKPHIVVVTANK